MSGVPLKNDQLKTLLAGRPDYLYHLGLDTSMDLRGMFGDTRFVCMGGSAVRTERLAEQVKATFPDFAPLHGISADGKLHAIGKTERFSLFKVGPVVCVNHGMGMPSHSILLHEITKLLHYAGALDVVYMRIGTSGGVGVEAGTVVVATEAFNDELQPYFRLVSLGKGINYPTKFDASLSLQVVECARAEPAIPCVVGNTLGADDFYEGQGRLDGALCSYTAADRQDFLDRALAAGISNIEMEAPQFAAFCARVGVPAVSINAVILNRMKGDQVDASPADLQRYSDNSQRVALRFIALRLGISQPKNC